MKNFFLFTTLLSMSFLCYGMEQEEPATTPSNITTKEQRAGLVDMLRSYESLKKTKTIFSPALSDFAQNYAQIKIEAEKTLAADIEEYKTQVQKITGEAFLASLSEATPALMPHLSQYLIHATSFINNGSVDLSKINVSEDEQALVLLHTIVHTIPKIHRAIQPHLERESKLCEQFKKKNSIDPAMCMEHTTITPEAYIGALTDIEVSKIYQSLTSS